MKNSHINRLVLLLAISAIFVCSASIFSQVRKMPIAKAPPKPLTFEQTCAACVTKTHDKSTGKYSIAGRKFFVSNDNAEGINLRVLTVDDNSKMVELIVVSKSPCTGERAKIEMLFRDGSQRTAITKNPSNCDGDATLYFGGVFGNQELFETLKKSPLEAMRIFTYKSSVQANFSVTQSNELMNQLKCVDGTP